MKNIIIADDYPLTLIGTKAFVETLGYRVIESCNSGILAYNSIVSSIPDIALIDLSMPGMSGIDILEKIKPLKLVTKVVLLTMHNEISIFNRAKELGAAGYILKEFAEFELEKCLEQVSKNNNWFSPHLEKALVIDNAEQADSDLQKLTFAEKKILALVGQQQSSKQIAEALFISEKTVEKHRSSIIQKLKLPSEKNALLIWAIKNNLS
jgi:DNA-binding NarL/FixJ family response regulator